MKKTFIVAGLLSSFLLAAPAAAQGQTSAGFNLVSPDPNSTVTGPFNFVLQKQAQCEMFGISLRNEDGSGGAIGNGSYVGQSEIRISVDPSKPLGPTEGPEGDDNLKLHEGTVIVAVISTNCDDNTDSKNVLARFTYASGGNATATPSAEPTATPSLAPTITPTPVEAEASEGWFDNLDPALVLLIGALAGGGATGLAEYSWIRHRRKHGK